MNIYIYIYEFRLYNCKQYDHYKIKILNDLVHITLLYTINIYAEGKLCMHSQYIRNINIIIYKYIKQNKNIKVNRYIYPKCSKCI